MNCVILRLNKTAGAGNKLKYEWSGLSDNLKELSSRGTGSAPMAVIVDDGKDYDKILKNGKSLKDRGIKNPHKQLSRYMFGHKDAIPCIRAEFAVCRQLKNSVRALLENKECRNGDLFIIAVGKEIIEALNDEKAETSSKADAKIKATGSAEEADKKEKMKNDVNENIKGSKTSGAKDKNKNKDKGKTSAETGKTDTETSGSAAFARSNKSSMSKTILELLSKTAVPKELCETFYGDSAEFQIIRQLIMLASKCEEPVLLLGETGTGKEVVSRSIHEYYLTDKGKDFKNPCAPKLVTVNCGAISKELFESELFGYKKGAFNGAYRDKDGLWKVADGGTLFLDEIGDLHPDHQVKILRALQDGTFLPVGATREESSHPRIIAATNRDLFSMVQTGQFREDLYYRLRIFLIRTPSLNENPENLKIIAEKCWESITKDPKCSIAKDVLAELQAHKWPGNVRELKALLSGVFSLFRDKVLRNEHVRTLLQLQGPQPEVKNRETGKDGEIGLFKIECLRHLRRADEVVQACKATFSNIADDKNSDPARDANFRSFMQYRLNELETLCQQTVLFHNEETFSLVYKLKGKLIYFLDVVGLNKDRGYIHKSKSEIGPLFKMVQAAIVKEVAEIVG
ncbi:MAG: type IV pilus expression regulatory protein [uncultured bacterium]|nr:MAG: type IV pilus expression regulatory protein [uncultured bacterium]